MYTEQKENQTLLYQKLEDLIYLLKKDIHKHPNFKSFLWSLESRGIYGIDYGVLLKEDYEEYDADAVFLGDYYADNIIFDGKTYIFNYESINDSNRWKSVV